MPILYTMTIRGITYHDKKCDYVNCINTFTTTSDKKVFCSQSCERLSNNPTEAARIEGIKRLTKEYIDAKRTTQ